MHGMTALMEATTSANIKALKRLLKVRDIQPCAQDKTGRTALHWACDAGHMEVARRLLEYGAAPNAQNVDGSTPLHMACVCEHLELARLMLERGADSSIRDGDGQSPADLAPAAMVEALQLR